MLKHNPKLKKAHNKAKWRRPYKNMPDICYLDMRYKSSKEYVKEFGEGIENSVKNLSHDQQKYISSVIKKI